jgi:mono/diheme cytochrome c family protein
LRAVLGLIPDLESLRKEGSEVVFTADDGYVATMALDDALTGNGLIAFRDLDAPAGKDWQPFKQGKETTTPGPFYVVWPNQDPDDWAYPWPYQLATIDVVPFSEAYGKAMPDGGDARVRKGFNVFRTYCLKCHSVNLAGGELAPELNVPKNVTEYWDRDVLAAFVGDVPSFRAGSKMPSFVGLLTHEDIDLALDYLVHMASQKVCSTAESCEAMVE